VILGFLVAFFSAGIGIGGGVIFVSVFISVFKFDFKRAAGLSLAAIIPITFIGSLFHLFYFPDTAPGKYFMVFIPMCMLGTLIGSKFIHQWNSLWLKRIFAVFLLVVSLKMLKVVDFPFLLFSSLQDISWTREAIFIMGFGICTGILATWLGIGCGLIIVPFFTIVMGFSMHEAIGLSLTTMFFLTLSATMMHHKLSHLDVASYKNLILPALGGAVTGSLVSGALPGVFLRYLFAVILMLFACVDLLGPMIHTTHLNKPKDVSVKEI
jgi:uncharacterized membrane protein YfcA